MIARHEEAGFDFVHTPEISKGGLFHTSGHLPYYADTMFPPMVVDEETGPDGAVVRAGQEQQRQEFQPEAIRSAHS